jgi:hypothetical protein
MRRSVGFTDAIHHDGRLFVAHLCGCVHARHRTPRPSCRRLAMPWGVGQLARGLISMPRRLGRGLRLRSLGINLRRRFRRDSAAWDIEIVGDGLAISDEGYSPDLTDPRPQFVSSTGDELRGPDIDGDHATSSPTAQGTLVVAGDADEPGGGGELDPSRWPHSIRVAGRFLRRDHCRTDHHGRRAS